jgi:hypothetical protein
MSVAIRLSYRYFSLEFNVALAGPGPNVQHNNTTLLLRAVCLMDDPVRCRRVSQHHTERVSLHARQCTAQQPLLPQQVRLYFTLMRQPAGAVLGRASASDVLFVPVFPYRASDTTN